MHSPDRLDPDEADRPGREKGRSYGRDGTPHVSEFAAAELGARTGRTTFAAGLVVEIYRDLPEARLDWDAA